MDGNVSNNDGNTPPQWVDGKIGKALQFDGVDDYVIVNDSISLNPVTAITISMMVKLTSDPNCDGNNNWRSVMRKGSAAGTTSGYDIVLEESRAFTFDIGSTYNIRYYGYGGVLPLNEWTFVAFVYDSSIPQTKIYFNGNEINGQYWSRGNGTIISNTQPLYINNPSVSCPAGSGNFPGIIDEVRIYNRALSDEEIKLLYQLTKRDLKLTLTNFGINLGKKFNIELEYEDGNVVFRNITLNKIFETGETIEQILFDLPKGTIKKITIYSLDVCPNIIVGIKNVNIEI
ncbi:MAG: LamG domain-containing protein [Candidatus Aenigmatarchaeota archaeon]